MILGALLVVADASVFKRCGCDKDEAEILAGALTIAGRTYDFETGAGVPGVQLTFDGVANDYTVTTGVGGAFTLGVDPGDYQVKTWLDGFDERIKDLTLGASTSTFDIPLARIHTGNLVIQDTYVTQDDPTEISSGDDHLAIGRKSGPGSHVQTFLKIGLPAAAPWGAKIHEARMHALTFEAEAFDPDAEMTLCRVVTDFDVAGLTWFTKPEVVEEALGERLGISDNGPPWSMTFDVAEVLEAYRDPNPVRPTFGVNWVTESPAGARVSSTECASAACGMPLNGTVRWSAEPPDFP